MLWAAFDLNFDITEPPIELAMRVTHHQTHDLPPSTRPRHLHRISSLRPGGVHVGTELVSAALHVGTSPEGDGRGERFRPRTWPRLADPTASNRDTDVWNVFIRPLGESVFFGQNHNFVRVTAALCVSNSFHPRVYVPKFAVDAEVELADRNTACLRGWTVADGQIEGPKVWHDTPG